MTHRQSKKNLKFMVSELAKKLSGDLDKEFLKLALLYGAKPHQHEYVEIAPPGKPRVTSWLNGKIIYASSHFECVTCGAMAEVMFERDAAPAKWRAP